VSRRAPTATLQHELLRMLAGQARRVPLPVFLAAAMIAGIAHDRVDSAVIAGWLALVAVMLAVRWQLLGRLPEMESLPERQRLRIAIALSAINGSIHGLSVGFFPFLTEFERALQSMLFVALAAGSVATTAGYRPVLLAYLLPTLGPLAVMWALSPGIPQPGWVERSTAGLLVVFIALLDALGRDAFRLFRESFAIRLQQVELNRQLQIALERAEAANRAKTRFLASASHDLRQPIQTLTLFAAALTMRPLDAPSREIAEHMNTALQALASQLTALLDISKLDAGVIRVNPARLNLRAVAERLCREFEPAARAKGLALRLSCPAQCWVQTDALLFDRVLRNVLDNAVKYTDAGQVRVQVRADGEHYSVAVVDSGRGIPEQEQARVFEEFYQLDNPERDRTKGLGLGLAIVQRLAQLLQVRVDMESATGRGTTFRLALPRAEEAPVATDGSPAEQADLPELHVLVVDDEAGIRLGMKTLLEGMGCRTTLADSTSEAVAAAQAERPDIVLSDMRLRGSENGIETVRALRRLYPGLPAILISGDIAPDRLREAEQAGIALLHKPVPVETLKREIAKIV
jgi:signal transduction histidine kinase